MCYVLRGFLRARVDSSMPRGMDGADSQTVLMFDAMLLYILYCTRLVALFILLCDRTIYT